MALRLVHAADLHLGGRRWLTRQPAHEELRTRLAEADRGALRALVGLCLEERADVLLLAGDVLDGWCRRYEVALRLAAELGRLAEVGCQALIVLGNHDVRQRMLASLPLPGCARLLGLRGVETYGDEARGLAVHGLSCGEGTGDVTELYPEPIPGAFNVGLLHTSAEGAAGHVEYAPCSRLALRRKGYDYWALGHVHAHQVLWREPYVVYPGNLQGRGPRELGPKGALLVEVTAGKVTRLEHRALAPVRFERVVVDASEVGTFGELVLLAERRLCEVSSGDGTCIADVVFTGPSCAARALEVSRASRAARFEELRLAWRPGEPWLHEVSFDASELGLLLSA